MEPIYRPYQWPIPLFPLFEAGFGFIIVFFGIAFLLIKPENRTFKEILRKIGYFFAGIFCCCFGALCLFIGLRGVVQSIGKAAVAVIGNYDTVEGRVENADLDFDRDLYYVGSFSVENIKFNLESKMMGAAYIRGEEKAELIKNYPILVKYKRIFGMNVIISIDAITDSG